MPKMGEPYSHCSTIAMSEHTEQNVINFGTSQNVDSRIDAEYKLYLLMFMIGEERD